MKGYCFDGSDGYDVQSTLDIHLSHKKSKSLDNINSINDNLNTYPQKDYFKRGDVDYIAITVGIPSNDYDYIYGRFDKCLGETSELMDCFFEESITHQVDLMRDDDKGEKLNWEISLPLPTMKKLNGMIYSHETMGEQFTPITLDEFIVFMVDELYSQNESSYNESGEKLSEIMEGLKDGS